MANKCVWLAVMAVSLGIGVAEVDGQFRRRGDGGGPGGGGAGQQQADGKDTFTHAMEAMAAKKLEVGIRLMETFVNNSPGDPRMDKATRTLHDARLALAKEFIASGREIEAARLYLELGEDAEKFKESKDTYVKLAISTLQTGLADAQKRRAYDKVLEIEKAWKKEFPDKPGLLSPEEIATTHMDAVIAAGDDKFNQVTLPDIVERHYPGGTAPWEELAKRNKGVPVMGMYFRALAELGWAGRYLAELQRLEAESPVRAEKHFAGQTERMYLRRCEAAMILGNVPEARKAIAVARSEVTSPGGQATLKAMESKLPPDVTDTLAGKTDNKKLRDLAFAAPVAGKKTWDDKGEGFGEAKDVLIEDGAEVKVVPGFTLHGGTITVKRARLRLAGTPAQPVMLRNVQLKGEDGSHITIENAVLVNCTFSKAGGMPTDMHSTKWEMTESLMYRCRFSGLAQWDYGVQMTNCAWVEGAMPKRSALPMGDITNAFSGRWDSISASLFLRSQLAVSVIWMSRNCNFVRCSSGSEDFANKNGLAIPLYVPEGDPAGWKLREWTVEGDVGDVTFGFSRKPLEVKVPGVMWSLLPVDLPERVQDADQGQDRGQDPQPGRGWGRGRGRGRN